MSPGSPLRLISDGAAPAATARASRTRAWPRLIGWLGWRSPLAGGMLGSVCATLTPTCRELIEFAGLSDVLGVEVRRQSKQRKQPSCVEEERELGDPAI